MSLPLIFACLWVIAGTFVSFLPMRLQYPPGVMLLVAAPCLLIWIGFEHGFWLAFACTLGFASMFRRPLSHFAQETLRGSEEVSR